MPVPSLMRFPGAQGLTWPSVLTLLFMTLLNVDQNVTILLLTWVLPGVQGGEGRAWSTCSLSPVQRPQRCAPVLRCAC